MVFGNHGNLVFIFQTQRPLEFGADLVMHSASKYLGGHADIIAGVLATRQDQLYKDLKEIQRFRGATPSAFDCYLLERSLQTLEVIPIQIKKPKLEN